MAAADSRPMYVALNWVERHCVIPDGFRLGAPFRLYLDQGDYLKAFYSVRTDAAWDPENPVKAPAFLYRRAMNVGPQKLGKDPLAAAHICLEGVGPALFGGWAGKDDGFVCSDHGCSCGWEYAYDPGEPMGMRWPTPLIQITAVSEDQTGNTYDALRPMIDQGPLHDLIPYTGEALIRLPAGGDSKIETVTSSAPSRLGQPLTFASQGEVGLYTARNGMIKVAETQRRNAAGMGGRTSANTNAWDPAQHSYAQRTWEDIHRAKDPLTDVYVQFVQPPASLSFTDRRERWKIFQAIYPFDVRRENGGHLDINSVESEAVELLGQSPADAMRFFGNLLVKGGGRAFDIQRFRQLAVKEPRIVPRGAQITIGGDGSRLWDDFSLIATEIISGYQWPLGIWHPGGPGKEVPLDQVDATLTSAFEMFDVWRAYLDPPFIETWVALWAGRWGKERVEEWWTNRPKQMACATRAWDEALRSGELSHCAESEALCGMFTAHVGNANRHETGYRDDGGVLWYAEKDGTNSPDKMDSVPAAVLSWQARNDALTAGALNVEQFVSAYDGLTGEQVAARMLI
jgi:hypothetical protein